MSLAKVGAAGLLVLALAACGERKPPSLGAPLLVKKAGAESEGGAALALGKLVLRDGCLALEGAGGERTLLLWPARARIERSADGSVKVFGAEARQTVRVGQEIVVSGGELAAGKGAVGPDGPVKASAAFPAECAGSVWNVSSFEPAPDLFGGVTAADLQGRWMVDKLNGAGRGPTDHIVRVTIEENRLHAQSQCVPYRWTFTVSSGEFRAAKAPNPDPVCERTRSFYELAFEEAIDRAASLERQGEAIMIRGPGGQVLLQKE